MLIFYIVLAVVTGVALWFDREAFLEKWIPLGIVVLVTFALPVSTYAITVAVAKDADQTYYEYWNGFEKEATLKVVQCERDGWCVNEYNCDPYTEVYYVTVTDSKGNSSQEMRTRTKYHDCPYSTTETSYYVDTTLGVFTVAGNVQTGKPFRVGHSANIVNDPPKLWVDAKTRIANGTPGGVTQRHKYKNFILASDKTILKDYSDKIEQYVKKGLMGKVVTNVNVYQADKAYFATKNKRLDKARLTEQVAALGGALGLERQGDLHVVFVDATQVTNHAEYTKTLKAYWVSPAQEHNAIAKNAVVLVVGVKNEQGKPTADWVDGFTGMPMGNEGLIQAFKSNLIGQTIDDGFLGSPTYNVATGKVTHSAGLVDMTLNGANGFKRVSMEALDKGDNGNGYKYLADDWEPPTTMVMTLNFVGAMMVCGGIAGYVVIRNRY